MSAGNIRRAFTISNFTCNDCGNTIPLPRKSSKQRENGHIKDIYCVVCKKVTKHTEAREFDFVYNKQNTKSVYK